MPTTDVTTGTEPNFVIVDVRQQRVVLDKDVARLFGTEVRKLNQQVTRNKQKFGEEFAFKLTWEEVGQLRSQNVIFGDERGRRSTRRPPLLSTA